LDPSSIVPLVDGGTEGFKGSARVIFPHMTACIACTLYMFPPQLNYPMCTIANTPRLPEHCIEYIKAVLWEKEAPFKGESLDTDKPNHVHWVYEKASNRAEKFGINGVDMRLTVGVLKRVIPAVASTNAIIANSCVLEAFKLISNSALPLNNYVNFQDLSGVTFNVVKVEKTPDCVACGDRTRTMEFSMTDTLRKLLDILHADFHFRTPSISSSTTVLYMINSLMPQLKEISEKNLERTFRELLLVDGSNLLVTDDSLINPITIQLKLTS